MTMWSPTTVLYSGIFIEIVAAEELTWKQERIRDYVNYTFVTIAAAICAALLWRAGSTFVRHQRRTKPGDIQATTGTFSAITSAFKKHVLYAAISRSRKARDIIVGPGAGVNLGVLPTRLEAVFIGTYLIINILFIFVDIDYTASKGVYLYAIRNRSGGVLTANLVSSHLLEGWVVGYGIQGRTDWQLWDRFLCFCLPPGIIHSSRYLTSPSTNSTCFIDGSEELSP